jgi:rhodanese-related sulfurtransferase
MLRKWQSRPWRRTAMAFLISALALLLSGFDWPLSIGRLTWERIDQAIAREYPLVRQVDVEQLRARLTKGELLQLVDVRNAEEYRVSHLPGAVLIDSFRPETVGPDAMIVVYCSVGLRSAEYAEQLRQQGYRQVYNLQGSIFAWANSGYPLETGNGRPTTIVHPYDRRWGELLKPEYRGESAP